MDAAATFFKDFNVSMKTGSKFNVYSDGKLLLYVLSDEDRSFGMLPNGERVTYKTKFQFFPKETLYNMKDGSMFCRVKDKGFFSRAKLIEFPADQSKYYMTYNFKMNKILEIQRDFEVQIKNQSQEVVAKIRSDKNLPAYKNDPNCEAAGTIELSKNISPDKIVGFLFAFIRNVLQNERQAS